MMKRIKMDYKWMKLWKEKRATLSVEMGMMILLLLYI